jgi:tetratricopeptide (TPR) repeat protein
VTSSRRAAAVVVVAVLVAVVVSTACGARGPQLPSLPPVAGMAPEERAAILAARARVEETPDASRAWLDYARELLRAREAEPAEEAVLRAEGLPGADPFLCAYVAGIAAGSAQDRAVAHIERALRARDDYGPAHLRLGALLQESGRIDEADAHYRRALALGMRGHALLGLGRIALARGETDAAIQLLEDARGWNPQQPEIVVALAAAYQRAGRADRATVTARSVPRQHLATPLPDPVLVEFFAKH